THTDFNQLAVPLVALTVNIDTLAMVLGSTGEQENSLVVRGGFEVQSGGECIALNRSAGETFYAHIESTGQDGERGFSTLIGQPEYADPRYFQMQPNATFRITIAQKNTAWGGAQRKWSPCEGAPAAAGLVPTRLLKDPRFTPQLVKLQKYMRP